MSATTDTAHTTTPTRRPNGAEPLRHRHEPAPYPLLFNKLPKSRPVYPDRICEIYSDRELRALVKHNGLKEGDHSKIAKAKAVAAFFNSGQTGPASVGWGASGGGEEELGFPEEEDAPEQKKRKRAAQAADTVTISSELFDQVVAAAVRQRERTKEIAVADAGGINDKPQAIPKPDAVQEQTRASIVKGNPPPSSADDEYWQKLERLRKYKVFAAGYVGTLQESIAQFERSLATMPEGEAKVKEVKKRALFVRVAEIMEGFERMYQVTPRLRRTLDNMEYVLNFVVERPRVACEGV